MDWLFPAVLSTLIGVLLLCAAYGYLYSVYRERFLGYWTLAWGVYVVRYLTLLTMISLGRSQVLYFLNMSAIVLALYFLYCGTGDFLALAPSPNWRLTFVAIEGWVAIAIFGQFSFLQLTVPLFGFMAFVLIWTGWKFLGSSLAPGFGKRITGLTFILWGLHQADFPLLRPVAWFAPFGFMIGTTCAVTIALGILLVYFETVRGKLQQSQERAKALIQKAPDPVFLHDRDGRILDVNLKAEEYLGYSKTELQAMHLPQIVPDIIEDQGRPRWDFLPVDQTKVIATHHRRKDGSLIPVEVHSTAIELGEEVCYLGFVRDQTAKIEAEQQLKASEETYRTLVEEASYGIALADPKSGLIVDCNRALEQLSGRPQEELIGQPQSVLHPAEPGDETLSRSFREHLQGKSGQVVEDMLLTKDGELREVEIKAQLIRVRDRELMLGFFHDVTERNNAFRALRQRDARIRLLLDSTAEAIYGLDRQGNCTFCNRACIEMLGYASENDLLGRNMHTLVHHTRADGTSHSIAECRIFNSFLRQEKIHADDDILWRADGSSFPVEYWSHPIVENGLVVGGVVTFIDISQRRYLEEQSIRSAQLASIGELASGVAHEINNPINGVINYAEILRRGIKTDASTDEILDRIIKEADRVASIVGNLLFFARDSQDKRVPTSIDFLVESCLSLMAKLLELDGIRTVIDIAPDLPSVSVNPQKIEQLLINLISNAHHALNERYPETDPGKKLAISAGLHRVRDDAFCRIEIRDQGIGMPPELLAKATKSFFTTKPAGIGTGLGLSICEQIVKQHRGSMQIASRPQQGTRVTIDLPLWAGPETPVQKKRADRL